MLDREAWEELGELYLEVSPVPVTCLHVQMLRTRHAKLQVALTCNHKPQFVQIQLTFSSSFCAKACSLLLLSVWKTMMCKQTKSLTAAHCRQVFISKRHIAMKSFCCTCPATQHTMYSMQTSCTLLAAPMLLITEQMSLPVTTAQHSRTMQLQCA